MNNSVYSPRESGYYPPGAEFDPNAPWNEKEPHKKEIDVCCSQSLSKISSTEADFDEYDEEFIDLDYDYEQQHETPLSIIQAFQKALENKKLPNNIDYWIEECKGWIKDETTIIEN